MYHINGQFVSVGMGPVSDWGGSSSQIETRNNEMLLSGLLGFHIAPPLPLVRNKNTASTTIRGMSNKQPQCVHNTDTTEPITLTGM